MDLSKLKKLIDIEYTWPDTYIFKFIAKPQYRNEIIKAVGHDPYVEKSSKTNKYISYTFKVEVLSSKEVIDIYEKVSKIEGVISL